MELPGWNATAAGTTFIPIIGRGMSQAVNRASTY
jgi:hypothetical protein